MLSLLDQAIAFVKAIHDCIRCVEGDDSRERIILQWDVRLQRTHPPHEFDRVISIAAADMGRENLDPVRFRKRYYDKWVAELRMLRGGYSFDAEARKLIENALSNSHFDFLSVGRGICLIFNGTEGGAGARQHSWWDWWRFRESEREQQILPGREDQVGRDRRQLAEKIVARAELCPRIAPEFVANITDRMDGEGQ